MKVIKSIVAFLWIAAVSAVSTKKGDLATSLGQLNPKSLSIQVPDNAQNGNKKRGRVVAVGANAALVNNTPPRGGEAAVKISKELTNALLGTAAMAGIEKLMKEVLKALDIKFPAMLAGCLTLFATLLLLDQVQPKLASSIATFLTPSAALLAKWLPMFFVPGLALLPLAPSVGGNLEIVKVLGVVVLGLLYSILTVSSTVMFFRGGSLKFGGSVAKVVKAGKNVKSTVAPKPFTEQQMKLFGFATAVAAVLMVFFNKSDFGKFFETSFLTFFTVAGYMWAARLPSSYVKVVHPLVTTCVMILGLVKVLSVVSNRDFYAILRAYKVGSLDLKKAGSGDILLFLLGPSAVSFALGMYSKRTLLQQNLVTILTAVLVSSVGGLYGTAAFVRLISLGGTFGAGIIRLSMLSRNVTTALALPLTAMIGGDLALAAAVVCMTGVIGATYGKAFLAYFGITDPVTRGLAIGSSAQGLGVASMSDESDAFPFAAIAMVLTAVTSTTLVSFPLVKNSLVQLATGSKI
eukprot:CAMPEP_0198144970 /NCGR_PEP_ID=MMETSP1443-20131203/20027_1 /TAXON_ID=186043 /ORGANISM="Entomoneis sp., Strain CCMP2396" /LENGTH=518 /DNA_ID=CAMNT_0043808479 /DNA_START=55 /DNA_END=1611 /DNA_ORIENTATION=+